jgi:hypothetical protein
VDDVFEVFVGHGCGCEVLCDYVIVGGSERSLVE